MLSSGQRGQCAAFTITYLLWNLPHALQSAVQVAAPQHDAAIDHSVAALGSSNNGRDKAAPILVYTGVWT